MSQDYQYPQQPWAPQHIVTPATPRNGVGLASLIIAIVALALCWIPIVGYASVILGVIGVVLAIVGLVNVRRGIAANPVVTILGGVLSIAALILPWVFLAVFMNAVEERFDEATAYSDCIEKAIDEDTPLEACTP
jgi:hypothetical protein